MSKAESVFRTLLKELGLNIAEEQGENAVAFKSEEYKFTLNVHRGEDGVFEKTVLEKSEGEEACQKFQAVVDAVTELLKACPSSDKPKDEAKSEESDEAKSEEKPEGEAKEGEKKEDESEAKEGEESTEPAAEPAAEATADA